jgi:hypothetical protein
MQRTFVLGLVLLASAAGIQAQYASSQSPGGAVPTQVEGCLQTVRGHYSVTDANGSKVELSGAANKLGKLVGHTVQVSGTPGIRTSDTTSQGAASTAVEIPVLKVSTVKDMGKNCK